MNMVPRHRVGTVSSLRHASADERRDHLGCAKKGVRLGTQQYAEARLQPSEFKLHTFHPSTPYLTTNRFSFLFDFRLDGAVSTHRTLSSTPNGCWIFPHLSCTLVHHRMRHPPQNALLTWLSSELRFFKFIFHPKVLCGFGFYLDCALSNPSFTTKL